jgi:hypothetical protein
VVAVLDQIDQQIENLRFDRNRGTGAAQFPPVRVEFAVVELPPHRALCLRRDWDFAPNGK